MKDRIDIKATLNAPGLKRTGFLPLSDGDGRLPVSVVSGKKPGPVAWVNASIHGDEYLGTAAIGRLFPALDPEAMTGGVIFTPVLNMPAFQEMRRTNSRHDVDLNRAWAGGVHPGTTTRIRDEVAAEIFERSDIVVDLHSGGNHYLQGAFTVYHRVGGAVEDRSRAMAKACSLPLIWSDGTSFLEGALITAAAKKGKPAVLVEIGGEGKVEEHWVLRMVAAVRGALSQAGVLQGEPHLLPEYRLFREFSLVKNGKAGLWERRIEPGEEVQKGNTLGHVLDPFGAVIEAVKAPVGANLLGIYTYGYVAEGETIAELGHDFRVVGPDG